MVSYDVTVSTAHVAAATTFSNVFIKLVGEDGESERKWLASFKGAAAFIKGAVSLRFHSSTTCLECALCSRKKPAVRGFKGLLLISSLGV